MDTAVFSRPAQPALGVLLIRGITPPSRDKRIVRRAARHQGVGLTRRRSLALTGMLLLPCALAAGAALPRPARAE